MLIDLVLFAKNHVLVVNLELLPLAVILRASRGKISFHLNRVLVVNLVLRHIVVI